MAPVIVDDSDVRAIAKAADMLRRGSVIVAPTDTNYAVCCDPFNPAAAARLYAMKGRVASKPLTLFVPSAADWPRWALPPTHLGFQGLLDEVWPGPLNVILRRRPLIPDWVTSGGDTVAVVHNRCQALNLLSLYSGLPLAATSANISGTVDTGLVDFSTAMGHLGAHADAAIRRGTASQYTASSTIVDLTADPPRIIRQGDLAAEVVRRYLPAVAEKAAS